MTELLSPLKRFLRTKGWKPTDEFETFVLWDAPESDDQDKPIRLSLPINSEFEDTSASMDKACELLSLLYDEPLIQLKQSIQNIGYDSFRQRINLDSKDDSVPLPVISKAITNLEKLIKNAACLEDNNQPFFPKTKKIGADTAEKCRFAQTFKGSFGLELKMPIPPSVRTSSDRKVPFERRVMHRLGRGFLDILHAVREADVSLLLNKYESGFNANIFEVLQELIEILPNGKGEFSFSWSPEYSIPHDLLNLRTFRLTADDTIPLLQSAAKELRKCSESEDTHVTGKIIQLHSGTEFLDSDEESETSDQEVGRLMVISWEAERGRPTKLRVALSENEHQLACDAYKNNKIVSVKGRPEKRGNFFYLTGPRDFLVHSSTSDEA